MPVVVGPILNSTGAPASGWIRVQNSRPFDIGEAGHVTQARASVRVIQGDPSVDGSPWIIPPTPEGTHMTIEQDLDGETLQRFTVSVPDVAQATYSQILFSRGGTGKGGPNPYWWDLTGGANFPADAVDGDFGFDSVTGDVWRYGA